MRRVWHSIILTTGSPVELDGNNGHETLEKGAAIVWYGRGMFYIHAIDPAEYPGGINPTESHVITRTDVMGRPLSQPEAVAFMGDWLRNATADAFTRVKEQG